MVSSLLSARTRISSCFLALTARRRPTSLPVAPRVPRTRAAISRPSTTGAATIVDRSAAPPIPAPHASCYQDGVNGVDRIDPAAVFFVQVSPPLAVNGPSRSWPLAAATGGLALGLDPKVDRRPD